MRIVVALGGNALLRRGEPPDAKTQLENLALAVPSITKLAAEHDMVITHGNGPQVGLLALESAADPALSEGYPLDALGAETQGLIGYWLAREIGSRLPGREVVALVTQTVVSAGDPAFAAPSKFVGPIYDREEAQHLARERGWRIGQDGPAWRRVVASPKPQDIVELPTIRRLLGQQVIVIASGGGGVPVLRAPDGVLRGCEAVVDKDLAAAWLAVALGAHMLLLLTDVPAVFAGFGTAQARAIPWATPKMLRLTSFPPGSMGPKVEAACQFVTATGGVAAIGALNDTEALAARQAGTIVVPEASRRTVLCGRCTHARPP